MGSFLFSMKSFSTSMIPPSSFTRHDIWQILFCSSILISRSSPSTTPPNDDSTPDKGIITQYFGGQLGVPNYDFQACLEIIPLGGIKMWPRVLSTIQPQSPTSLRQSMACHTPHSAIESSAEVNHDIIYSWWLIFLFSSLHAAEPHSKGYVYHGTWPQIGYPRRFFMHT